MQRLSQIKWNRHYYLYRGEVQSGTMECFHAHEGFEFLFVHEGSGETVVNGRRYEFGPRSLLLFPPYQVHALRVYPPYVRTCLKIRLPWTEPCSLLFPLLYEFLSNLEKQPPDCPVFQLTDRQEDYLEQAIGQASESLELCTAEEQQETAMLFVLQLISYLKLHVFPSTMTGQREKTGIPGHYAEHMIKWVDHHYTEDFSLSRLASELHLSPNYVSNMFRQYTGSTLRDYVSRKRLERACLLLETTSLSIERIGKESGIPNAAHFCRVFKKMFRLTPQQYRLEKQRQYRFSDEDEAGRRSSP
ncbi:AraC family transcriptional regulator [Paenibacillus oceani]|uniref:AraC family transcriptional regulator n=1 Tax=Paenibacillus oceani TaxID=2772510 RepID=A0A927CDQ7_9BACL|nr:AraC family transcriptional regulator [Paenibacillus oceani]MBD2865584.1 AraC family transcriptional regulator [Paenibacillus oceani]